MIKRSNWRRERYIKLKGEVGRSNMNQEESRGVDGGGREKRMSKR